MLVCEGLVKVRKPALDAFLLLLALLLFSLALMDLRVTFWNAFALLPAFIYAFHTNRTQEKVDDLAVAHEGQREDLPVAHHS
jgi:Ca2+/Na+ antiporter